MGRSLEKDGWTFPSPLTCLDTGQNQNTPVPARVHEIIIKSEDNEALNSVLPSSFDHPSWWRVGGRRDEWTPVTQFPAVVFSLDKTQEADPGVRVIATQSLKRWHRAR